MLAKNMSSDTEDATPEMDEGWWASVLADEEAYAAPPKLLASKSTPGSSLWTGNESKTF
jgi:hypothetical protein